MAKAKAEITIFNIKDIKSVTRYYLLQSSTAAVPSKPTTITPGSNWKTTEPSYTDGSTNTLYFVDLTIMSDGKTFSYSDVSKSSSYEAAKAAWNKANNAQNTANGIADNIYTPKTTTIDGGKITTGSIKADQIDVENLFAQDIKATGSISGATIKGASGEFTKDFSVNTPVGSDDNPNTFQIMHNEDGVFIGLKSQEQAQSYVKLDGVIAALVGRIVSIGGVSSVNISGQNGINLNGCDVMIEKDMRTSGNYYRKGNLIGETLRATGTKKTVPNIAWTNLVSLKLPAGAYIIMGTVAYDASKGGRLGARFADDTQGYDVTMQLQPGMPSSMTSWVQCSWIVSGDDITYYLQAFQQTGSSLGATGNIKAIRIA